MINLGKNFITACLMLVLLASCSQPNEATVSQPEKTKKADLIIHNVTVIDALNGRRDNMDVIINGNVISEITKVAKGTAATTTTKQTAERYADYVDGTGKYLIPGLWDAHVHLTFDEQISSRVMNRLFIANGVTSVRDTGGLLNLVLQAREQAKDEISPDIYFAGPLLDGVPAVYAGDTPGFPEIGKGVATPEQATAAVDELASAGAHLIKAYELLTPETYKAVLSRAKHHQLPVTGHVPLSMTAIEASNAGLNSMEHMRNLELACASNEAALLTQRKAWLDDTDNKLGSTIRTHIHSQQRPNAVSSYDSNRCSNLISALIRNQTWQVPTMALNMWVKTPYYADPEWQKSYAGLPKSVAQSWVEEGSKVAANVAKPTPENEKLIMHADWQIEMLQRLVKEGVTIMAGTDTPIYFLTPGNSLHLELETLVEKGGMTPQQALEAATLTPARYFNLQGKLGTIEPNKIADLVLLNANPLERIQNTTTVRSVIKGGQLLDRKALDQLLINE